MRRFIMRRFFTMILSLFIITILVFSISRLYGDPLALLVPQYSYGMTDEAMEAAVERLHLDEPIPVQYGYWLWDLLHGDLGLDIVDRRPIGPKFAQKIWPSVYLGIAGWLFATLVGTPLGVLSAVKRGSVWDYVGRIFANAGLSLPSFWIAILLVLVFSVWWGLLPTSRMGDGFSPSHWVLPVFVLAWSPIGAYLRLVRSSMLEQMDSEYVKLARAKGVPLRTVIWRHAFRNALLSPITFSALLLAGFLNGALAAEIVFAWPGIARWAVEAVWQNNFTVVGLTTLVFSTIFIVANFTVDVLYAWIDPRIKYS